MNVFAWLLVLALTDATFAGYRAAAGRDARLHKADYYLKAFWMGLAGGVLGALVVAAVTFALLWWQLRSGAAFEHLRGELEAAAARLVFAYAIFATLMLSVMLLWTYPKRQLRELSVVMILGPCTLIRPYWIFGGALYAAWPAAPWVQALCFVAAVVQLSIEAALNRVQRRAQLARMRQWGVG